MTDFGRESAEHFEALDGEVFGSREFGSMEQLREQTEAHVFTTAEALLPSNTTHVTIEIPGTHSGKKELVDDEGKTFHFPVERDEDGKLHITRTGKAAVALAGLGILTVAAIRIVPKVLHKK